MPSDLLLETGDRLLLESGDGLLLEITDQTISLPVVDGGEVLAPSIFAGAILLPLIDGGEAMPPTVAGSVTVSLPLLDDSQVLAPRVFVDQLANLPLIDDGAVYAPSFVFDLSLPLDLIDGGWALAPNVLRETDVGTVELLVDGVAVDDSFARSFEEQLADTGSFSFQVLREDFASIAFDDLVRFKLDGVPRFCGVVEGLDHVALSPGEDADQTVTVAGRGSLALFDQAVVYPSRGVDVLPIEEVRTFSWVAPDFDDSTWPLAKKVNRQRSYATWRAPLPHIWPDTTGYWIAPNLPSYTAVSGPTGAFLCRKSFTLAADATVRVFGAGDNSLVAYLDGAPISEGKSFTTGKYVDIDLTAGTHYIAARGNNYPKATLPNPGGIIMAGYTVGDAGLLDDLVFHTDATWRSIYIGSGAFPGYTHGEVIRILVEEAGMDADWSLDFTDTLDSSGAPWDEHQEIAVQVGRTLLEVLREMSDTYVDVAAAPGSLTLRAWARGTRGATRSVTLQQTTDPDTSDFLALSHQGKRTRFNTGLIRYAGGHTEKVDAGSVSSYGTRGAYVELGAVQGAAEAKRFAAELMQNRAQPAYATTATLHPRGDSTTPYRAFEVGDWITCPDETDANASMRVLSVALSEDDEGVIDWPVRLRDEQLELEERHDTWLRRMADGAVVGGARVSSRAGTPQPFAADIAVLKVAEFSFDNSQITTGLWPRRPAEVSGNIVECYGELTTAGSTTTTIVVTLNGSTLGTLTFAAGETEAEFPVSPPEPVKANVDKVQINCTAAGSGAEGLDVQVRAI